MLITGMTLGRVLFERSPYSRLGIQEKSADPDETRAPILRAERPPPYVARPLNGPLPPHREIRF